MALSACSFLCPPSLGCLTTPPPLISPPRLTCNAELAGVALHLFKEPPAHLNSGFRLPSSLLLQRQLGAKLPHDKRRLPWFRRLKDFQPCPAQETARAMEQSTPGGLASDGALERGGYELPSREVGLLFRAFLSHSKICPCSNFHEVLI